MGLRNFIRRFSFEWRIAPSKRKLLLGELIWRLGFDVPFLAYTTTDGSRLRLHAQVISLGLWKGTYSDYHGIQFCLDYIEPNDLILDVGANIGHFSVAMGRRLNTSGQILAIEPHPVAFKCLKENVTVNRLQNVQCFEYALDQFDGVTNPFFVPHRTSDQGALGMKSAKIRYDRFQVHCRTGTALIAELGLAERRVNLLKIDVEGHELDVLQGLDAQLARVDCILFEFSEENYAGAGVSGAQVLDFMRAHGLHVAQVDVTKKAAHILNQSIERADLVAIRTPDLLTARTGYQWVEEA